MAAQMNMWLFHFLNDIHGKVLGCLCNKLQRSCASMVNSLIDVNHSIIHEIVDSQRCTNNLVSFPRSGIREGLMEHATVFNVRKS